ncbi:MAG TPA: hypothetical protein VFR38_12900 [Gaiellaceae bacterium]|nr:hypothetical protein [Gaiellaceae bacterium]
MREKRLNHRRVATAVSVSAAVVLFAALGGAGLAQTALAPARGLVTQDQGGEKVEICHKGKNTISISVNALPAHLRHGDTESECAVVALATDTTGAAKAKKEKQSTESAEETATENTKKPKREKGTKSASAGGQEKAKLAKSKSKKKAAAGTSDETNVAPTTSQKPKMQKPMKSKGGSPSPPGLGGASPPGHANGKGNGKNT